jgi:xanthine/CO dehydrogenase XdhC/CoxF family maturation factor
VNLLVDSTGVTMAGEGEWQARKQGPGRRRQWREVHPAMDAAAGDIWAVEFTSSPTGDSPARPNPLARIPADQAIGAVTADGACDTPTCHTAIAGRGGAAFVGAPVHWTGS